MTRYILIQRSPTQVFFDEVANSPIEAALQGDTSINVGGLRYAPTHRDDIHATFDVYRAPDGFTDEISPDDVEAVEEGCDYEVTLKAVGPEEGRPTP